MTSTYALRDSTTMLRRDLRHLQRYPGLSLFPILMPVVILLLFVYVFGGTLGNGITVGGGRGTYINFLTPGMLLFTVAGAAQITAISVAKDMTEGIIARFKTMRIWRPAVLAGHVFSSLVLTLISLAVTIAAALLIGYHSAAGPLRWLGALGVLVLLAVALIWLSVALGLLAKSVETASNIPMFLILLPFLGSGFVPVALDARRPTLVRRESAVHPDHQHRAQPARQPARRQRRRQGDRVVPRDHRRQLSMGQVPLQPRTRPVAIIPSTQPVRPRATSAALRGSTVPTRSRS
jgi:ABC-2 type transport system permease protein